MGSDPASDTAQRSCQAWHLFGSVLPRFKKIYTPPTLYAFAPLSSLFGAGCQIKNEPPSLAESSTLAVTKPS
jgi:hypothetical protein